MGHWDIDVGFRRTLSSGQQAQSQSYKVTNFSGQVSIKADQACSSEFQVHIHEHIQRSMMLAIALLVA